MKKSPRLNLFLLPTMAFILTQSAINSAYAKMPSEFETQSALSFANSLNQSDETFERLFNYRNMKGEHLRAHQAKESSGAQGNLWSQLDPTLDGIEGTSTAKTYLDPSFPKAGKEIIVAVIDSGVDITHEDLQGHIWTNPHPGTGNGEGNDGYVNDIHGWNFIGGRDGTNITNNTLEITREVARLTAKSKTQALKGAEAAYFKKLKTQFDTELLEAKEDLTFYQSMDSAITLLKQNGLTAETVDGVNAVPGTSDAINQAKALALRLFSHKDENGNTFTTADLKEWLDDASVKVNYGYNLAFDSTQISGDDSTKMDNIDYSTPECKADKKQCVRAYGNNDVTGDLDGALHATHVAGIIAADRNNNIGILGQADDVKIMSLRTVPNGDERDKDVANAIRYAVKHGASVINMSFGKEYSPHKAYVDAAVAYAEANHVILVHAAGNDGKNTESLANNFPNRRLFQNTAKAHQANDWIEVGASYKTKDATLPAPFSNWGKTSVDLFAPGMAIDSSVPGNLYKELQGTSMACPEVAGIAALLLSHFPQKSSTDVISAMMNHTTQYPGLVVNLPGSTTKEQITFSTLSKTGGIVNTYSAMEALLK